MTKLTTESLEKFVNDIKTDGMCDITDSQVESALIRLLAYEQAAKNPIGSFHISDGKVEATTDYCRDGEWPVQDGEVLVYAAPVLPKQSELVENLKKVMNNWLAMEPKLAFQPEFTDVMMLLDAEAAPAQPVIPEQAKPVAYTDNRNLKSLQKGCNTALLWLKHNAEVGDIPLYTELPAQPVSEPYKLPSRWVLVPLEPTAAMFHAFNDCDYGRKSMRERYIQMIEAAPAQEQK